MEQKIIYVVTSGEYSDYHIVAIFDNEELANKYADSGDDYGLETYTLNEPADLIKQGLIKFHVRMYKDGSLSRIDKDGYAKEVTERSYMNIDRPYHPDNKDRPKEDFLVVCVNCLAKDEQHAIKIANEIRLQRIAGNQWHKD